MMTKNGLLTTFTALLLLTSSAVFACGGENSGKHIGQVTSVNPAKNTFTIMDMESRMNITFNANTEVMAAVKKNPKASIMVNYEENDEGALDALGVTF